VNFLRSITGAFYRVVWAFNRATFYADFAEMHKRGENVLAWLEGEIENARRVGQDWRVWGLKAIGARYQSGQRAGSMVFTLGGVMPEADLMLLAAVDRAEDRSAALLAVAENVRIRGAIKLTVAKEMLLPAVIAPISYWLTIILSDVMVKIDQAAPPYIKPVLWRGANLLAKTVAEFTLSWGAWVVGLGAAGLAVAVWSLPRWTGRMRLRLDKAPLYSLYRDFQSALLFTAIATFLKTGAPLRASLEDIAGHSNRWTKWQIKRVIASLDYNPSAKVEAFSRGLVSPAIVARMNTLSRSAPTFSDVLIELGTTGTKVVHTKIKATAFITGISLVGVLATVATFMGLAAMFVPGDFANIVDDPANLMLLQKQYAAEQAKAKATQSN